MNTPIRVVGQPWVSVERQTLAGWRDDPGIDGFIFWPPDFATDQAERFATEVVPALRVAIGAGG